MDAKSVWRLEVSVTSCNQLASTEDDDKIFFMDWYRKRLELYTRIYGDKFVLRERQGHKDKRNDPIVHFLDFEGAKAVKHAKPKGARESDCEKRFLLNSVMLRSFSRLSLSQSVQLLPAFGLRLTAV